MSEIDDVAAQVLRPLSATAVNVVADAFRLGIAENERYDESEVAIEKFEFAAFAVGGLAAAAGPPAAGQVRASSRMEVPLADSGGGTDRAGITVTLFGPGDVLALDASQIIRRYPAPGTLTAEETVLAHVEFNRPELPWAFSPPGARGAPSPWVALIVVERSKAGWEPSTRHLPVITVPLDELPPLSAAPTWAHAQAPQTDNGAPLEVRLSPEYAPVNLSRLLSPRVLRENTDYVAAVVPATDIGVRRGLGLDGGTLTDAWTSNSPDPVRLPVYDSWQFRTGPNGDFATLALRLQGVVAPYEVGRRFLDTSEPGLPLGSLPQGAAGAKQVIRCALFSPQDPPTAERAEAETAVWPDAVVQELRTQLDFPAKLEGAGERTTGIPDLPILGPRIYAELHRGSPVITGSDWFAEINLAPTKRVVAGLGTRVVQHDQEQLMQAAWAQVGELEKANSAIRLAQLAELIATRVHARLDALQQGRLLQVAAPLATRISVHAGRSLRADIAASATPAAAVTGAFRRVTRPDGPMLRRAATVSRQRAGELVGGEAALRDFTRVYRNPDGIGGLSAASISVLDARSVAAAIDVPATDVRRVLLAAADGVRGGLASYLSDTTRWGEPQRELDLGAAIAEQWGRRILKEPSNPAVKAVRAQRVGPLLAELSRAKPSRDPGLRKRLESEAFELNNAILTRLQEEDDDGLIRGEPVRVGRGRRNRDRVLRASPLGRAVGGIPVGGTVRSSVRAGRVDSAVSGVQEIDVSLLTRITGESSAATRAEALSALSGLAVVPITPVLDRIDELPVDVLRAEMATLIDPAGVLLIDRVPHRDTLAVDSLFDALDPRKTVRASLSGRLRLPPALAERWRSQPRIVPILAAPRFDRPMYQALNVYDRDWLVPGLGLLPEDDFVTVLSTNGEFMEAFLLGLSDEMGRELLWRNFPTDQRGTYFRRFWDAHQDELTQQIHMFSRTPLGSHISVGGSGSGEGRAVILVKSELVRRYPDAIIQVVRNQGDDTNPVFERAGSPQQTAEQLFSAFLEPDIALVGVDLSISQITQPEWWILIAEHPTATRFDRPLDAELSPTERFLTVPGVTDGAHYAKERLHDPVRVAFQATDVLRRGA